MREHYSRGRAHTTTHSTHVIEESMNMIATYSVTVCLSLLTASALEYTEPEHVQSFKEMLGKYPESGRVVFTYRVDDAVPLMYEAAWFAGDYTIRTSSPEESPATVARSAAGGRWTGVRWTHSAGDLRWYYAEPSQRERFRRDHAGVDSGEHILLRQVLSLGIQNLDAISWSHNNITGTLSLGRQIRGTIRTNSEGRVAELTYSVPEVLSQSAIAYDYAHNSPHSFPSSIIVRSAHGGHIARTVEFKVIEWQSPLSFEQWIEYSPERLFGGARTILYTNGAYLARSGTTLTPMSPASHQQNATRIYYIVAMAVILVGGPLTYALYKLLTNKQ
jgi:hypothetical protein